MQYAKQYLPFMKIKIVSITKSICMMNLSHLSVYFYNHYININSITDLQFNLLYLINILYSLFNPNSKKL